MCMMNERVEEHLCNLIAEKYDQGHRNITRREIENYLTARRVELAQSLTSLNLPHGINFETNGNLSLPENIPIEFIHANLIGRRGMGGMARTDAANPSPFLSDSDNQEVRSAKRRAIDILSESPAKRFGGAMIPRIQTDGRGKDGTGVPNDQNRVASSPEYSSSEHSTDGENGNRGHVYVGNINALQNDQNRVASSPEYSSSEHSSDGENGNRRYVFLGNIHVLQPGMLVRVGLKKFRIPDLPMFHYMTDENRERQTDALETINATIRDIVDCYDGQLNNK